MSQILLILTFVLVTVPDLFGAPVFDTAPAPAVAISLGLFTLISTVAHLAITACTRTVDRTGSWRAIRRGERIARFTRLLAIAVHAFNILALGLVGALRSLLGDIPLLIELLAITPPLLVWAASWWSVEPLERRLREAALMRDLDTGTPLYPIQSRAAFVWMSLRHQVFFIAAPIVIILAWGQCVSAVAQHLGASAHRPRGTPPSTGIELIAGVVQVLGVVLTFILMPALLRRIWSTTPLGPGPLRDTLLALCQRSGVRVRELLVWRTNGQLINGAAVGLVRPLRYIMLTDALLDRLTQPQIEAVTAHEIAHIRRHHMFWLAACMVGAALALGTIAELALYAVSDHLILVFGAPIDIDSMFSGPASLVMLGLTLAVLGLVSRRFEWQADAFAVSALSQVPALASNLSEPVTTITPDAVHAMSSALGSVAALNGLSPRAPSWRHGSIATRQHKLKEIIGLPINALPIDRAVRRIKLATILAITLSIAASAFNPWDSPREPSAHASVNEPINTQTWKTHASLALSTINP